MEPTPGSKPSEAQSFVVNALKSRHGKIFAISCTRNFARTMSKLFNNFDIESAYCTLTRYSQHKVTVPNPCKYIWFHMDNPEFNRKDLLTFRDLADKTNVPILLTSATLTNRNKQMDSNFDNIKGVCVSLEKR